MSGKTPRKNPINSFLDVVSVCLVLISLVALCFVVTKPYRSKAEPEPAKTAVDGQKRYITKNIEDINQKADRCLTDMEACMTGVKCANQSFDTIYDDVARATDGIIEITNGISRINDVASNNAATTEEQASTITEILNLSDQIVEESNKLLSETESISHVSENLNQYSDAINSDLSRYEL